MDTPRAYWKMGISTASLGTNTSTITNTATGVSSRIVKGDNARYYNGTSSYSSTASSAYNGSLTDTSVEFFFYANSLPTTWATLVEIGSYTSTGQSMLVRLNSDGSLTYGHYNGGLKTATTSALTNPTGTWHHIVLTFSEGNMGTNLYDLYVDGSLFDSHSMSNSSSGITSHRFSIGRLSNTNSNYFEGYIDEVSFYTDWLDSSYVANHYNARNAGSPCIALPKTVSGTAVSYAILLDGTNTSLAINNTTICSVATLPSYSASSSDLRFGRDSVGGHNWGGKLEQLLFYGTTDGSSPGSLSDATTNYYAGINRFRSTPIEPIAKSGLVIELDPANSAAAFGFGGQATGSSWYSTISSSANYMLTGATKGTGTSIDPYVQRFDLGTTSQPGNYIQTYPSTDGTLEAWVKYSGTQSAYAPNTVYGPITSFADDSCYTSSYDNALLGLDSADPSTAKLRWAPFNRSTSITGTQNIGTGWRHVAVTFSGSTHKLYLDGLLEATGTIAGTFSSVVNGQPSFYIGGWALWNSNCDYGGGVSFGGDMGPFRTYNRALTETEIKQNCWAQKNRFSGANCAAP